VKGEIVDVEYSEFQDALKGLKTATDNVNAKRAALITAVNQKATDFGAQVASDTAHPANPTQTP
jgi:hypothetical protein